MKSSSNSSLVVLTLVLTALSGIVSSLQAQTNYFFRHPALVSPPPPAGLDGNWFTDISGNTNWYEPNLQNNFIPNYEFNERAFVENGGTVFVNTNGGISPAQVVLGSTSSTSGTLEVQSGGVLASRMGTLTNGNITVGSSAGIGTLRVLPGGTLTGEGALSQGSNSANLVRVGALAGGAATLTTTSAFLAAKVQVFPNATFGTTGAALLSGTTVYTSEITANGANGKFDVGATATLDGSLVLNFNSYAPSVGHNWNVVEAVGFSGNFSSITSNATLASNQNFVVSKPNVGGGQIGYNVALQEVLVLEVNRDTGSAILKHPGSSAIPLDGYFIGSAGGLVPANWNSWDAGNHFGGGWLATAATASNLGELKPTGDTSLPGGNVTNYNFGAVYNALAGPFGQNNEDLEFVYRRSSDGAQFPGRVHYTGTKVNTLLLQVDPTGSGQAYLRNTSEDTVFIDSYDVLSAAGSLTTAGWNSFDEQNYEGANTWLQVNSNANQIGEVNQLDFTQLDPGEALPLGALYTGGIKDLSFSFQLMGDATASVGRVIYEAFSASTPGDFDGDGDVDGRDFLRWQRGGSPTPLSAGDLAAWQANYGSNGPLMATSVAVPEPGSTVCMLIGMALISNMKTRSSSPFGI